MNGWVLLLALAFLAFIQRLALTRWGLKGLSYTRRFSRKTVFVDFRAIIV